MRKIIIIIAMLLLLLATISSTYAYRTSPYFRVQLISQEPDPVEPGDVVELRFKIENLRGETVEDVDFELMTYEPFTMAGTQKVVNVGQIRGRQTGSDAIIIDYKIKIDESASEGETEIELRYKIGEDDWRVYNEEQFLIDIQTFDAILHIEEVSTTPESMVPGDTAKLNMKIQNTGDSLIKDIKVSLNLNSSGLPFIPIGSSTEKRIYRIKSDERIDLSYDLGVLGNAESKFYKLPISFDYFDESGREYSKEDIVGVVVADEPSLMAYVKSSDIIKAGQKGTITVEVANSGVTDIKFLKLKLQEENGYNVISNNEVYIGDVDSDDTESEDFEVYVSKDSKNEISLPIIMDYKDANNKQFSEKRELKLMLYNNKQIKTMALEEPSKAWIFIAIIIFVIGFFVYRYVAKRIRKK